MSSDKPATQVEDARIDNADLLEWLDRREQALNGNQISYGVRTLFGRVSPSVRRRLYFLAVFMFVVSLLEAASIAALWPFLNFAGAGLEGASDVAPSEFTAYILALFDGSRQNVILASALVVGILAIVTALGRLALAWFTQTIINQVGHELSVVIYNGILRQPYALFIRRNSSEVLSGIDKVQGLVQGVLLPLLQGVSALVMIIVIAGVLLVLAPIATLIAAVFVGSIYGILIVVTKRRLRQVSSTLAETYTERIQSLQEGMGGIRDILIDGTADIFVKDFAQSDRRFRTANVHSNVISSSPRWIVEGLGIAVLALMAGLFAIGTGGLAGALPLLGVFALSALRILPLAQKIFSARTALASYSGLLQDVIRLTELPKRADDPADLRRLPLKKSLKFENVHFHHAGVSAAVLNGIELTIDQGTNVGIMGVSGSGKSTLLDLTMGLIEPTSGKLLIDDAPLNPTIVRRWQKGIAHVPQSIFLADTTIAANIAFGFGRDAIDETAMENAVRIADLKAFISTLPNGFATIVGERGASLSGGQRQRLGIARALYRKPQLLVLDEATSALDEASETRIIDA
ncbi:MAG: ABC transporter ATP-binding protein, partial [Pontixanthobacter sp.]